VRSETVPLVRGDVLAGKYRVESLIGEGGMGYVLAAEHIELGHRVALKVLRPSALESAEAVERFVREARAAARLQSEHIAKVSDIGRLDSGAPFMVMELLEGQDLAQLLDARTSLPIEEAVDYVVQACEALSDAHRHGIVHRDLKPANLFVTTKLDGTPFVKVLDFGISKTKLGDALRDITSTAAIIGSPKYMSPEQLQDSRNVDPRSDVWALGAILFEMLTGHVAFDAPTIATLCVKILQEEAPPLRVHRPELPVELEAVVLKCLKKEPRDRYESVADLASDLLPFAALDTRSLIARIARASRAGPPKVQDPPPSRPSSDVSLYGSSTSVRRLREANLRSARTPSKDAAPTLAPTGKTAVGRLLVAAFVLTALGAVAFLVLRSPTRTALPVAPAAPIAPVAAPSPEVAQTPVVPARAVESAEPAASATPSSAPSASETHAPRVPYVPAARPATLPVAATTAAPSATPSAAPPPVKPPAASGGVNDSVLEDRR